MSATREGGLKAAETNRMRYGFDYYKKISRVGGMVRDGKPTGFAYMKVHDPERLKHISTRGGKLSRKKSEKI